MSKKQFIKLNVNSGTKVVRTIKRLTATKHVFIFLGLQLTNLYFNVFKKVNIYIKSQMSHANLNNSDLSVFIIDRYNRLVRFTT